MNAEQIIDTLGGSAAVAADLGVSLQVVSNWKVRGISPAYWADLVELAKRKEHPGISLDVVKHAEGRPPRTVRRVDRSPELPARGEAA